jgi:hypothetical protein
MRGHVQATDVRVVGQAVRAWATVLRCAVARAACEGGLRWLEPMVEVACMHVWAPCRALMRVVVVCRRPGQVMCNCSSLFLKKIL